MNAKNKKEANRSGRRINLEVLPSEADKKKLETVVRGQGRGLRRQRRLNVTGNEREGELGTAKSSCHQLWQWNLRANINLRQTQRHKGLQSALCACATDAEADQCTTSWARLWSGLDQNRTAGFSVIDLDGSEI